MDSLPVHLLAADMFDVIDGCEHGLETHVGHETLEALQ